MEQPTFEQLPAMVALLLEKIESLEKLLKDMPLLTDSDSELMSIQQTSEFLKLTVPTLYSKVSRGEIPFSKPGKRLYFKKSELFKWIDKRKKNDFSKLNHPIHDFEVSRSLRHNRRIKKY